MRADTKKDVAARLKSIAGHLKAVERMVDEDTYCVDVLKQTMAIEKALERSPLAPKVRISQDRRGVVVSLSEAGFFDLGALPKDTSPATHRRLAERERGSYDGEYW